MYDGLDLLADYEPLPAYTPREVVVGLDLSKVGSAFVALDDDFEIEQMVVFNHGSATKQKLKRAIPLPGTLNLHYVSHGIRKLLLQHRPKFVVLEGYSGGGTAKPSNLYGIGEVGGVVKLAMLELGIPWVVLQALTLKKFVTGVGAGKKNVVLEGCYKKYGVGSETLTGDDNIIDAYCLARFGWAFLGSQEGTYDPARYEAETFKKAQEGETLARRARPKRSPRKV